MPSLQRSPGATRLASPLGARFSPAAVIGMSEATAQERADDDGMAGADSIVEPSAPDAARVLLDELSELSTRGGERDAASLGQFQHIVAELRAEPGATGAFCAKVASASGWAALLFSSWRHLKYDRPNVSGADRVRGFIARELLEARRIHQLDVDNDAHDSNVAWERRIGGRD